jgi:hypothetical protein
MKHKFHCEPQFYKMVATPPVQSLFRTLTARLQVFVKSGATALTSAQLEQVLSGYNRIFSELLAFCDGTREACEGADMAKCNTFLKAATAHWYAENGRVLELYMNTDSSIRFLLEAEPDAGKRRQIVQSIGDSLQNIKERRMHPGQMYVTKPHVPRQCPTCGQLALYKEGKKSSIRDHPLGDEEPAEASEGLRATLASLAAARRLRGGGGSGGGSGGSASAAGVGVGRHVASKKRSRESE